MQTQNITVATDAIAYITGCMRDDMPVRALNVLFRLAQRGPETVEDIAKALGKPQYTVKEDLCALRKPGKNSKVTRNLIQEILPVSDGKACCYRLSKRGETIMDDLDYRMQVFALPDDEDVGAIWAAPPYDDDIDEPLREWEASRSVVRG